MRVIYATAADIEAWPEEGGGEGGGQGEDHADPVLPHPDNHKTPRGDQGFV